MAHQDICFHDATGLAELIRRKELSPVEVVTAHLDRISAVNPLINAITTLMADQALASAKQAEQAVLQDEPLGALHGVPFTIKDSIDTGGVATMRGSRLFMEHVPQKDATTVTRFVAAGAIPLAKTNLPEFSSWGESDNLVTGYTRNPWNLDRTSGGSSGGESAAIAAHMSPIGLGSDVAFSVRGPSHYTGIAGLKATRGRIPITGHWPEVPRKYWHIGPMARSVRDLMTALAVLAGGDGLDGYATARSVPERAEHDLRVGWLVQPGFGPIDPDVAATVQRAAEALTGLGVAVEPVDIPTLAAHNWIELLTILFGAEAIPYFRQHVADRTSELHWVTVNMLAQPEASLSDYVSAQQKVEDLAAAFASYFAGYDALLCPTVPIPAPVPNQTEYVVDGVTVSTNHVACATSPFSLTGLPAMSLPFGISADGLPIGVQIVSSWFEEDTILRLGALLEPHSELCDRRPALTGDPSLDAK